MKKELLFKWIEIILTLVGAIGAVVILYQGNVELTICTLIFWAIFIAVYCLYRWRRIWGILVGIVALAVFFVGLIFIYFENDWLAAILFGLLIPTAGGVTIWVGGMLGMFVAEIVKFILNLFWPTQKAISNFKKNIA